MGTETAGIVSRYHRRLLVFPLVSVAWLVLAAAALGGSVSPATGNSVSPATSGGGAPTGTPEPMLAEVPYMGWNTYYGVGGVFDEGTIISVAKSLLHTGLARAGSIIAGLAITAAGYLRARLARVADPSQASS